MPKKTRLQKLQKKMRTTHQPLGAHTAVTESNWFQEDPHFKKDLAKSLFFAVSISLFEVVLYFIFYLKIFERR